jgi:hypothetical protein
MALAVSIDEPPPTATMKSAPLFLKAATPGLDVLYGRVGLDIVV